MNVEGIQKQIARIEELAKDNKHCGETHRMEKFLWEATLEAIAEGSLQADLLARAALQTREIEFVRHY